MPDGAPGVVIILLDDVGFGQASTFGGPVQTPSLQGLAATGLRHNRLHTAAICRPPRAALVTARNNHRVPCQMGGGLPVLQLHAATKYRDTPD
ncbi:sulfatase-like hydrolase/transferase [Stenotrophomonas rhizophila]|uniref:sulfatase-like hydrolase/transferase n=1 Tax=Stenotrophomonas rhizophila TaxID=216778 RepID=UPI0021691716|nr:sulfatase-like hydrolase/transferase [Stenotrophomonas rhizophila]